MPRHWRYNGSQFQYRLWKTPQTTHQTTNIITRTVPKSLTAADKTILPCVLGLAIFRLTPVMMRSSRRKPARRMKAGV